MSTRQRSDKTAKYKASFIYITPSILVKINFILGPISITPIVYKNQLSGYGFWTKFFMVFSYTVFLNNMFLRYMGVSRISGWSKKIIIIGGLSEARNIVGIKISCKNRIFLYL
jgi:hypothetical protein